MSELRVSQFFGKFFQIAAAVTLFAVASPAAMTATHKKTKKHGAVATQKASNRVRKAARVHSTAHRTLTARGRRHRWVQTWDEPTYANSTEGDILDGEDLSIRRAAVEALGPYNGSVVVVDPYTGRILTMVNQKLALGAGFIPCSTIKLSVAMAAIKENLIRESSTVRIARRSSMDLTTAIAKSNNFYFATLGQKLGYEKVAYYAHQFGYGEKAGWNIPGEHAGIFPSETPKSGVGMLTSFGEEIQQTPLELAALVSAIANGGKLWYLQYPRTQQEIQQFEPKLKRTLDIADAIPAIKPGMQGAVEYGTARRARQDMDVLGKTGTCSQGKTRLGWFGSFNDVGPRKLVVVVMLTGGRPSIGPLAAGVAGDVYRHLADEKVLSMDEGFRPESLVATQICCGSR